MTAMPATGAKTSLTDPLRIGEIGPAAAKIRGSIGLTFCPGKQQDNASEGTWRRDLALDLDWIEEWGAASIASVMETQEFTLLGVPDLGREIRARGIAWYHLPVADFHAPGEEFAAAWATAGPALHEQLRQGRKLLIHCQGGLGRTGTIAALLLIESGHRAPEAMAIVRRARPGAIENRAQEDWLLARAERSPPEVGISGKRTRD